MNDVIKFSGGGTGLMSREDLGTFLNSAAVAIPQGSGGKQFLKISDKDGVWTYGAEETVVEDDALWAINPLSFFHGYIAWHDGKPEQEHRQSVSRPHLPDPATLPPVKAKNGYQVQYGFELVCISGEDEGVVCEYKASSTGGKRGTGEVVNAINSRAGVDPDSIVPIVKLRNNKYWDKKYKKDQFPPVFEVVEWRSLNDASPVGESDRQEEEVKEPARRRAAPAATTAPEPTDEDEALAAEYAAEKEAQAPSAEASPRRRVRR